jgi:hypothetical protein
MLFSPSYHYLLSSILYLLSAYTGMESPSPFTERQVLVATDASNRLPGLSPTKVAAVKKNALALPIPTIDTDLPQRDYIGMHAVDAAEEEDINYDYTIASHRSIALLLGRARNAAEEEAGTSEASVHPTLASTPIRRIALPCSALHVSRDHAIIFHSPFGSAWAVKVLGQNGLIINGKRKKAGVILKLIPFQSTLDFFGVKCLFIGSHEEEFESSRLQSAAENGQSPEKTTQSTSRPVLGMEQVSVATSQPLVSSPLKRKTLGNPLKRPLGAPPSPPTSSPARFDNSSPIKRGYTRARLLVPSSSPVPEAEDSDETSDDDSEARGSPSLSRRGAKADDSGVAFDIDSADEASQALRKAAPKLASFQNSDAEMDFVSEHDKEKSSSPTPIIKRSERRVKFVSQDHPRLQAKEKANAETPKIAITSSTALPYFQQIQSHLRSQVALLAETYDLQGLLAQAIVFHRTATISATEAVRSVLSSTPGLLRGEVGPDRAAPLGLQARTTLSGWTFEEIAKMDVACGDELDREKVELWQKKAWREKLEECLMEGDCFGIISRAGKDASGNPLECWYYYDKDGDTGESTSECIRREQLADNLICRFGKVC